MFISCCPPPVQAGAMHRGANVPRHVRDISRAQNCAHLYGLHWSVVNARKGADVSNWETNTPKTELRFSRKPLQNRIVHWSICPKSQFLYKMTCEQRHNKGKFMIVENLVLIEVKIHHQITGLIRIVHIGLRNESNELFLQRLQLVFHWNNSKFALIWTTQYCDKILVVQKNFFRSLLLKLFENGNDKIILYLFCLYLQ